MTLFLNLGIILLSGTALWIGALWVVNSASAIAKRLGLSELVIGLTVVAIATSAPEFAVTISAAINNQPAISVGNVIGSNIFNLGFILGIVAFFSIVTTSKALVFRDGSLLIITALMLLWFFSDLTLSFVEGIVLFSVLVIYIVILITKKEKADEEVPAGEFKWLDVPKLIAGVAVIIIGANFLVDSAAEIARIIGVSEWMIGITIVAGGTSIPELATSIVAVYKKKFGISAGNLIGSDLFNMLGVLGIAAIINPLKIELSEYNSLYLLLAALLILFVFMRTGWKVSKTEGALLLLIAFFRWGFDIIF